MTLEYYAIHALMQGNLQYAEQQRGTGAVRTHRPPRSDRAERNRWSRRRALGRKAGESR